MDSDKGAPGEGSLYLIATDRGTYGAGNRDRTGGLKITNLALYQLSYPGLVWRFEGNHGAGDGNRTRDQQLGRL